MPPPDSLRQLYESEVALRGFEADAAQAYAIERMDVLRTRAMAESSGTFWSRWQSQRAAMPGSAATQDRGIYLWGGVGRGKTWLMDLFYDNLPPQLRQRSHFHHFMRDVHEALRQIRRRAAPLDLVAQRIARHTRILCLDELFVADIADAMILASLFEGLLRRGVMLVITSNLPPRDLYRDGLQRSRFLPAIELLTDRLQVIAVDGGIDYRLRQLNRRPIYLDSGIADSDAALTQLFTQLTGLHAETDPQLRINGRPLRARRRSGDTVWFDFAELCDTARSQNDYSEIAEEFHTVLLSDIPVFTEPQHDNAARRFIALIDEFYDRGIKLIVSAAAAPDRLYRSERLQFEFRRTASRLTEMQGDAYLGRPRRA